MERGYEKKSDAELRRNSIFAYAGCAVYVLGMLAGMSAAVLLVIAN